MAANIFYSLFKFLFFSHLCLSLEIEKYVKSSDEDIDVDPTISQSDMVNPGSAQISEMENAGMTNSEPSSAGENVDSSNGNYLSSSVAQTEEAVDIDGQESYGNGALNQSKQQNETIAPSNLTEPAPAEIDSSEGSNGNIVNKTSEPSWSCKTFNLSEQSVIILDSSNNNNNNSLSSWIEEINRTMSCAVVLFYAKWCYFSAMLAPEYNAVGRAFKGMPILALDAYTHNSLNTRYGIVGVPTIILFHESKPIARFNRTRTFKDIVEFIHQSTGMEYNTSVEVSPEDYLGPLPSAPSGDRNYYLVASSLFVACVGLLLLWRLQYVQMLWEYLPSWAAVRTLFLPADRIKED